MIIRIVILLFIFIQLPTISIAGSGYYEDCYYETRDRISISASGQILKDLDKGIFSYNYIVKSNSQSEQNVWLFGVILPEKNIIIDAGFPVGWKQPGWSGKPTKYSHLREIKPPYSVSWTAPDGKDIKPSETVSGFTFKTSYGLPGIVDYYAEGYVSLPKCPEGMAVDFIPGYDDLTPYGPGVVSKTIGPTVPPADFNPLNFLNAIIFLKEEAFTLGWIDKSGIKTSLDAKLENAKLKIEQGDINAAKNILTAFLNEVEAQGCKSYDNCPIGKHLTSEVYALLFYNVNYLIEQLK